MKAFILLQMDLIKTSSAHATVAAQVSILVTVPIPMLVHQPTSDAVDDVRTDAPSTFRGLERPLHSGTKRKQFFIEGLRAHKYNSESVMPPDALSDIYEILPLNKRHTLRKEREIWNK